ncbi:hypothetical protein [Ammonifex degensii]|nr:hypothetical protein [Ammonifex degensii]
MASPIESIINCQTRTWLGEEELADLLRNKKPPGRCFTQIANFFTEVPPRLLLEFLDKHGIPAEALLEYYREYVRDTYPNRELEEMLG